MGCVRPVVPDFFFKSGISLAALPRNVAIYLRTLLQREPRRWGDAADDDDPARREICRRDEASAMRVA